MHYLNLAPFKRLGIDNTGLAMDCIEMPLAYAASKYHTDYFYAYFLGSHYFNNWGTNNRGFLDAKNEILSNMGLHMVEHAVQEKKAFFAYLCKEIDQGNPVFLILDYYQLFYETDHYLRDHIPHGVIITGYDEERQIFLLQESAHMRFVALFPLQLTFDMVYDMWSFSNSYWKEKQSTFYEKVYTFIYTPESILNFSVCKVLEKYYTGNCHGEDKLLKELEQLDLLAINTPVGMARFKREFHAGHCLFFEMVEMMIRRERINEDELFDFIALRKDYLDLRESVTAKIIRASIKHQKLLDKELAVLKEQLTLLDERLFAGISELVTMIHEKNGSRNLALTAKVKASSESSFNGMHFSCQRVIDGSHDDKLLDSMWASALEDEHPWLLFDFSIPVHIKRFVLYQNDTYCLHTYKIQGSNDEKDWMDIVAKNNNTESIATHYGNGKSYRYYKLDIITPSAFDHAARLFQFEAWG